MKQKILVVCIIVFLLILVRGCVEEKKEDEDSPDEEQKPKPVSYDVFSSQGDYLKQVILPNRIYHFKNGKKLVCPKCNKDLIEPDIDYNKAGVWCSCNQCDKTFDIPVPSHFCRECQNKFTFDDAIYKDAYSYNLTPEASKKQLWVGL